MVVDLAGQKTEKRPQTSRKEQGSGAGGKMVIKMAQRISVSVPRAIEAVIPMFG